MLHHITRCIIHIPTWLKMPYYYINHNCVGLFSHPFCSFCRFLILDSFFPRRVHKIMLFHLPMGFVCSSNINNHRKNHFLRTFAKHMHTFVIILFHISILSESHESLEKEIDKHLPIQKQNHFIRNRMLGCAPKREEKTHHTLNKVNVNAFQLFEKLSRTHTRLCIANLRVYVCAYVVRIRNMFRLDVSRTKVLTFNTSESASFYDPFGIK